MPKWSPDSLPDLSGRVYVVTGGNTGIGFWTVLNLARHNAKVFLACRNPEKGEHAIRQIREQVPDAQVELIVMDMMDLKSVCTAATTIRSRMDSLHGLINSAGIMAVPFAMSDDGYEPQFQTNYLAHWLLTYLLLPTLQATATRSPPGTVRIVNVSSMGHSFAPKEGISFEDTSLKDAFTFRRYGQSKLANILHSKALEKRYGPHRTGGAIDDPVAIWNISLHPGNVDTQLNTKSWGNSMLPVLRCLGVYIKPEEGSYTSLYAVAGNELKAVDSGSYLVPFGQKKKPQKIAEDSELADRLWVWTENEMRKGGFI